MAREHIPSRLFPKLFSLLSLACVKCRRQDSRSLPSLRKIPSARRVRFFPGMSGPPSMPEYHRCLCAAFRPTLHPRHQWFPEWPTTSVHRLRSPRNNHPHVFRHTGPRIPALTPSALRPTMRRPRPPLFQTVLPCRIRLH